MSYRCQTSGLATEVLRDVGRILQDSDALSQHSCCISRFD